MRRLVPHSNKLYASMHLNFISKLERRLMEDLARLVVEAGSVQTIAKVKGPFSNTTVARRLASWCFD
jgi:hypothetical protein